MEGNPRHSGGRSQKKNRLVGIEKESPHFLYNRVLVFPVALTWGVEFLFLASLESSEGIQGEFEENEAIEDSTGYLLHRTFYSKEHAIQSFLHYFEFPPEGPGGYHCINNNFSQH